MISARSGSVRLHIASLLVVWVVLGLLSCCVLVGLDRVGLLGGNDLVQLPEDDLSLRDGQLFGVAYGAVDPGGHQGVDIGAGGDASLPQLGIEGVAFLRAHQGPWGWLRGLITTAAWPSLVSHCDGGQSCWQGTTGSSLAAGHSGGPLAGGGIVTLSGLLLGQLILSIGQLFRDVGQAQDAVTVDPPGCLSCGAGYQLTLGLLAPVAPLGAWVQAQLAGPVQGPH